MPCKNREFCGCFSTNSRFPSPDYGRNWGRCKTLILQRPRVRSVAFCQVSGKASKIGIDAKNGIFLRSSHFLHGCCEERAVPLFALPKPKCQVQPAFGTLPGSHTPAVGGSRVASKFVFHPVCVQRRLEQEGVFEGHRVVLLALPEEGFRKVPIFAVKLSTLCRQLDGSASFWMWSRRRYLRRKRRIRTRPRLRIRLRFPLTRVSPARAAEGGRPCGGDGGSPV